MFDRLHWYFSLCKNLSLNMGFGIYDLLLSTLFFVNALAVLHEQRFLAKCTCARSTSGMLCLCPCCQLAGTSRSLTSSLSRADPWTCCIPRAPFCKVSQCTVRSNTLMTALFATQSRSSFATCSSSQCSSFLDEHLTESFMDDNTDDRKLMTRFHFI